jgi:hypothetical protein
VFDTVLGLPVHALVVHAVVVLVPVAALGVAAIAVVPRWRDRYGPLVLAVATAGLAMVPVATLSGSELEDRIGAGGVVKRQIDEHADLGALVIYPTAVMWLLAVALVVMSRRRVGHRALTVVAVLAVLAAGVAAGVVTRVGHLGSTAVWSCTIGSDACR